MTTVPPSLPAAPRPITPVARRRSWAEMPVRLWCVLAITLAVVIAYFTINQVMTGASERNLILNGIPVDAVLTQVGGTSNPLAAFRRNESVAAKVRYTLPGEENPRVVGGMLAISSEPNAVVHAGDPIPIRVDRTNPNLWTDRTEPRSWLVELSVVMLLFPILAFLLLIALLQRARILRVWRDGDAAEAIVVEVRQTALAPLSRQLRFTLTDGSSSQVCSLLIPTRAGIPAREEVIHLVMARGAPQRAILAKLYI
jgi:hypothetical protein